MEFDTRNYVADWFKGSVATCKVSDGLVQSII